MIGWLVPRCPVGTADKVWVERRMRWLAGRFGADRLRRAAVVRPTDEFFPDPYDGTEAAARKCLVRLCGYMGVPPAAVRLEVAEDDRMLDLQIRHANQAAERSAGTGRLAGRSFLELWPDSVSSGLFAACREVRESGRPADLRDHRWRFSAGGRVHTGLADIRVTRYRDGVLITWGRVRPAEPEPGRREARS